MAKKNKKLFDAAGEAARKLESKKTNTGGSGLTQDQINAGIQARRNSILSQPTRHQGTNSTAPAAVTGGSGRFGALELDRIQRHAGVESTYFEDERRTSERLKDRPSYAGNQPHTRLQDALRQSAQVKQQRGHDTQLRNRSNQGAGKMNTYNNPDGSVGYYYQRGKGEQAQLNATFNKNAVPSRVNGMMPQMIDAQNKAKRANIDSGNYYSQESENTMKYDDGKRTEYFERQGDAWISVPEERYDQARLLDNGRNPATYSAADRALDTAKSSWENLKAAGGGVLTSTNEGRENKGYQLAVEYMGGGVLSPKQEDFMRSTKAGQAVLKGDIQTARTLVNEETRERQLSEQGVLEQQQRANERAEVAKIGAGKGGQFLLDLERTGLDMAPGMALNAVMPGAFLTEMAFQSYGNSYNNARLQGASHDEAVLSGLQNAAVETLSEMMFAGGKALGKATGVKGIFHPGREVEDMALGFVRSTAGRDLVSAAMKLGLASAEEGAEELVAGILEPMFDAVIYQGGLGSLDWEQTLHDALYNTLVGAAMGGGFGTVDVAQSIIAGENIRANGNTINMINQGLGMPEDSKAYQIARKLNAQYQADPEALGRIDVSDLQRAIDEDFGEVQKDYDKKISQAEKVLASEGLAGVRTTAEQDYHEDNRNQLSDRYGDYYQEAKINILAQTADTGEVDANTVIRSEVASRQIARVLSGEGTAADSANIVADPVARETFEQLAKEKLPETNKAAIERINAINSSRHIAHVEEAVSMSEDEAFMRDAATILGADTDAFKVFREVIQDVEPANRDLAREGFVFLHDLGSRGGAFVPYLNSATAKLPVAAQKAAFDTGVTERNALTKEVKEREEAISKAKKEGGKKTRNNEVIAKLNEEEKEANAASIKAATLMQKALNVDIVLETNRTVKEAGMPASNGWYSNGQVHLNMDSGRAIEVVFSHEFTHHLQKFAPKEYQDLIDYVKEVKANNNEKAWQRMIDNKMAEYARGGARLKNRDAAIDEIVADMAVEFLNDEAAIQHLFESEPTLAEKISEVIRNIIDKILAFLGRADVGTQWKGMEDELKKARQMWLDAADVAKGNADLDLGESGTQFEISEKFYNQFDNWDGKTTGFAFTVGMTSAPVQEAIRVLNSRYNAGIKEGRRPIKWHATNVIRTIGKHDGMTKEVARELPKLLDDPRIIIRSKNEATPNRFLLIGDLTDAKGNLVTAVLEPQPISAKGNALDWVVIVSSQGRHNINGLLANSEILFEDKKRINEWLNVNGLQLPVRSSTIDSNNIVDEEAQSRNQNAQKEQDEKYLEAVRNGDMETAQKMVADAARRAGYNSPIVYHGTEYEFYEFKPSEFTTEANASGLTNIIGYFSEDEDYSAAYGDTKPFYVKMQKPLVFDENRQRTLRGWKQWFSKRGITGIKFDSGIEKDSLKGGQYEDGRYYIPWEIFDPGGPYWSGDGNLTEQIVAAGYDGMQWDYGEKAWIPFNANAIKSADSVTYDNNGNIIPLSKRFDESTADVRFSLSEDNREKLNEYSVDQTDGGTAVKYSLTSWNATDKKRLVNALIDAGHDRAAAEKWVEDVNTVASIIYGDMERLNYEADQFQDALKPNSEYFYTLDLSTLCQKRRLYQGTYNAIMHRIVNRGLLPEDTVRLREMMTEMGHEAPCGICYEESRKKNEGKFAETWLEKYKGETHEDPYIPTLADVTTTDGRANLRQNHPEALESYLAFQRTRGSANPKVSFTHTDYRQDILRMTRNDIRKVKHIGGLRIQSFSDFETVHVIDMMQAVLDMAAKNLTAQAYTKVPAFADIFGGTGIKINLSLIGQVKDGILWFDPKEGIDPDEAFRIREKYSDNVGTILVGANTESILAAWADSRIDMVIPFHRSGWSTKEFEQLGLGDYEDFQNYQAERYLDGSSPNGISLKDAKMEEIYSDDYWDYSKTGKENAEAYLKLCAKKHYRPVFYNFLHDNGDGTWSLQEDGSTDGYWKSLIDFKMYNNEGKGAPQVSVQPNFDMDAAKETMDKYEGNADTLPVANDVVERFVKEYQEKHPDAKFSLSDIGMTEQNGKAAWLPERIDRLIRQSGAESIPEYAKEYAVMMSPRDFLKLTASDDMVEDWSRRAQNVPDEVKGLPYREAVDRVWSRAKETGEWIHDNENYPLDQEELARQDQTPFLIIDAYDNTQIVGHEGRHRMRALMEAGITSVPVVINDTTSKYSKQNLGSMTLKAQNFGNGPVNGGASVVVHDLVPINEAHRAELEEKFGAKDSDQVKFSISAEEDQKYLDAVKRGDLETAQRMVDDAAKKAGYVAKAYHSTDKLFNEFKYGADVSGDTSYLNDYYYFSTDKAWSRAFAREERNIPANKVKTQEVYLKTGKVLDLSAYGRLTFPEWVRVLEDNGVKITERIRKHHVGAATEEADTIKLMFWQLIRYDINRGEYEANWKKAFIDAGYDSIHMQDWAHGRDGIVGDTFVVFNPNQAKSAKAVVRDDKRKVVPLSKRFDESTNDIRYSLTKDSLGRELTPGQKEYFKNSKAVDQNGNLAVVYHSTEYGGFTIFDPNASDDGRSLFFTSNRNMSESYTKKKGTEINPYEVGNQTPLEEAYDLDEAIERLREVEERGIAYVEVRVPANEEETDRRNHYVEIMHPGPDEILLDYMTLSDYLTDYPLSEFPDGPEGMRLMIRDSKTDWVHADMRNLSDLAEGYNDYVADYNFDSNVDPYESRDIRGTYSAYLNLENPLIIDAVGQRWDSFSNNGVSVRNYMVQEDENGREGVVLFLFDDEFDGGEFYTFDELKSQYNIPQEAIDKILSEGQGEIGLRNNQYYDLEENGFPEMGNTRGWSEYAAENGYDGVIIRNLHDNGVYGVSNEAGDVYIAFSSNQVKDIRNENPTDDPDIRFSFAGENALNANNMMLAIAKQWDEEGRDSEEIRKFTGWHKGYEGKWRFEIDDSQAVLDTYIKDWKKYDKATATKRYRNGEKVAADLDEFLKHDVLFANYPQLREFKLMYRRGGVTANSTTFGEFDPETNILYIYEACFREGKAKSTIMHEIQHAIQKLEHFASGSNPSNMYKGRSVPKKTKMDMLVDLNTLNEALRARAKDERYEDEWMPESLGLDGFKDHRARLTMSAMAKGDYEFIEVINKFGESLAKYEKAAENTRFGRYQRAAGEIEARDVQARLGMTEDQRRMQRPDIDRTDALLEDDFGDSLIEASRKEIQFQLANERDQEIAELQKKITRLTRDKRRTYGREAKEGDAVRVAKAILADTSSDFSLNQTVKGIKNVFTMLRRGDDFAEIYGEIQGLARSIADSSYDMVEVPGATSLADLRQMFLSARKKRGGSPLKILIPQNLIGDFDRVGGWKEFRRAHKGIVTLSVNSGEGYDTFVDGIAEEFGEQYRDAGGSAIDALITIIQDADSEEARHPERKVYRDQDIEGYVPDDVDLGVMGGYRESEVNSIIGRLLDDISTEIMPDLTFADRKAAEKDEAVKREVGREREKWEARREKWKADRDKRIAEMKEDKRLAVEAQRAKGEERLRKQAEMYRRQRERARERREENTSRRKTINHISRVAQRLSKKLLKPTDNQHIPERYRKAVADMLGWLDFENARTDAWAKRHGNVPSARILNMRMLKDIYAKIANDEELSKYIEPDDQVQDWLEYLSELDGMRLDDLSTGDLRMVRDVIDAVAWQINNADKALTEGLKQNRADIATQLMDELEAQKEEKLSDGMLKRFIKSDSTPVHFFDRLGLGVLKKIYKELTVAQDKHIKHLSEAQDYIEKNILSKWGNTRKVGPNNSLIKQWTEKSRKYTLENGKTIEMTGAQVMSLYALNKREQARKHLLGGGIVIAPAKVKRDLKGGVKDYLLNKELKKTRTELTAADIASIIGKMSQDQRDAAETMLKYLKTTSEWGNETSMKLYGYRKFTEDNYFPIKSAQEFIAGSNLELQRDKKIKNQGMTKQVNEYANNPVVIDDFFEVTTAHINQMSQYNSFVPILEDFDKIYQYREYDPETSKYGRSVKELIEQKHGRWSADYIENLMKNINGNYSNEVADIQGFEKLLRNWKAAKIGLSVRVLAQQPTAVVRAFNEIDPKYFVGTPRRGSHKRMWEICPIAEWKSWGYSQTDIHRSMRDTMMGDKHISDKLFFDMYGKADNLGWGIIFDAVERETKDLMKKGKLKFKYDDADYRKHVNERFRQIVDRTQVVDSVLHRSQLMRSQNTLTKAMTSFMAEPTISINTIMTAFTKAQQEARAGNKKAAAKAATRGMAVFVANAVAVSAAASLISAIRESYLPDDDDDEEKDLTKIQQWLIAHGIEEGSLLYSWMTGYFVEDFKDNINPFALVPVTKDLLNMLEGFESPNPMYALPENIIKNVNNIKKWVDEDGDTRYSGRYYIERAAESVAELFGVPASNIRKELIGLQNIYYRAISEKEYGDYLQDRWELNEEYKSNKNIFIDHYLNAKKAGHDDSAKDIREQLLKSTVRDDEGNLVFTDDAIQKRAWSVYAPNYKDDVIAGKDVSKQEKDLKSVGVTQDDIDDKKGKALVSAISDAVEMGDNDRLDQLRKSLAGYGYDDYDVDKKIKSAANDLMYDAIDAEDYDDAERYIKVITNATDYTRDDVVSNITTHYMSNYYEAMDAGDRSGVDRVTNILNRYGVKSSTIKEKEAEHYKDYYRQKAYMAYSRGDTDEAYRIATAYNNKYPGVYSKGVDGMIYGIQNLSDETVRRYTNSAKFNDWQIPW